MMGTAATNLGYAFQLVIPLAVGITIGITVASAWTDGSQIVRAALQTDSMLTWIFVTCQHDRIRVAHINGHDYCVWFDGAMVPLALAEAETIAAFLKCECVNDGVDA